MMDEYAYVNGKKLRKGFTTGTCATTATIAALSMICGAWSRCAPCGHDTASEL